MTRGYYVFCIALVTAGSAMAAGLWQAASFPKNADDLTFSQRLGLLSDGYEPFETVFDGGGRCISGCPYPGFTLRDQLEQNAQAEIESAKYFAQADNTESTPGNDTNGGCDNTNHNDQLGNGQPETPQPDNKPNGDGQPETRQPDNNQPDSNPSDGSPGNNNGSSGNGGRGCSVFNENIPVGNSAPRGEPVKNCPPVTSRYGIRHGRMHDAYDLSVPVGTSVFTVADGTVTKVVNVNNNACGLYVRIKHTNGMITVYCHLSKIMVTQGQQVKAGCEIAKSGNTGRSFGAHLHYSIRLPDNRSVDPARWLTCRR